MDHIEESFEWDENKSLKALDDHGIDFYTARHIWDYKPYIVPTLQRHFVVERDGAIRKEKRWKAIGRIRGEVWTAIFTKRQGRFRIITCRPARDDERSRYDQELNRR